MWIVENLNDVEISLVYNYQFLKYFFEKQVHHTSV